MAGYIDSPGPFNPQTQKWSSYQTQFEHFWRLITSRKLKKDLVSYYSYGSRNMKFWKALWFLTSQRTRTLLPYFINSQLTLNPSNSRSPNSINSGRTNKVSQTLANYIAEIQKLEILADYIAEILNLTSMYLPVSTRVPIGHAYHCLCSWTLRWEHFL